MSIQENLGADVAMCLDVCPALPATKDTIAEAVDRTVRWAGRCKEAHTRADQALFGIVQGGEPRRPPPGVRRGAGRAGLRWLRRGRGERGRGPRAGPPGAWRSRITAPARSTGPRYLMGVGRPQDILDAIATGIDLFDCVLPTRNGRNATCLTARAGNVKLRNADPPPRPRTDRGGVRMPGLPAVQPIVPPPPVHRQRDARADPGVDPQPNRYLQSADGGPARRSGRVDSSS